MQSFPLSVEYTSDLNSYYFGEDKYFKVNIDDYNKSCKNQTLCCYGMISIFLVTTVDEGLKNSFMPIVTPSLS